MKLRITDLPRLTQLTDEAVTEHTENHNYFDWRKLSINQKYLPGLLAVYFPYSYRISFPISENPEELITLLETLEAMGPYTYLTGGNSYFDVFFKDSSDITLLSLHLS